LSPFSAIFGLILTYVLKTECREMSPVKGGKEERDRTSKLTNLSFVSSVTGAQANGTWAFIQPRPNLFLELAPFSSCAASQRAFSVGTRGRGGCFAGKTG